ncbi:hypothetical protein VNO77_03419 [Canavalia gladiata]|uniref:NUP210 Ig-like domain-containing protein n=1 Tax=Canavalia gladiata TaxID=3824 RepID=A0AAN9MUQ2_CANGL
MMHTASPYVVSGLHIIVVNILLPPKTNFPIEYRLQRSDGCFKWSWDHHDVMSVVPEYNLSSKCSTSARLQLIAPYSGRKETSIYATDVQTGTVVRCKAFDNEENVFSSLVGLQFKWTLMPEANGLPHHHWSILNTSVTQVGSKTWLEYAWNLGITTVIVKDTGAAGYVQVSSLNVVLPTSLCLYISPLSSSGDLVEGIKSIPLMIHWYVVSGRQYLIQIKVFVHDHDAQEIYITENDNVKIDDNESDYWKAVWISNDIVVKHGWWNSQILKAYSPGKLIASLSYLGGADDKKEMITVVQEVMVCDQVKFSLGSDTSIIVNATQELSYLETVPSNQLHSSIDHLPCSSRSPLPCIDGFSYQ